MEIVITIEKENTILVNEKNVINTKTNFYVKIRIRKLKIKTPQVLITKKLVMKYTNY